MKLRPRFGFPFASAAIAAFLLSAVPAFGQETTGGLQGLVSIKSDKSPLPGVSVEAVHVPTGTRFMSVTTASGRFTILNVRVGGPYTVTAKIAGFKSETLKDIDIALGEKRDVAFELELEARAETVSVTAEAEPLISPTRMGSAQSVSNAEIKALPTIRRQFQDFARTSPYVNVAASDPTQTNISVSGKNNRYNTIQIDGAVNNDLFGLASTGTPGGLTDTQPISLDTIQEIQVAVSPYDIKQSGFTGGAINAITRSGTNEFHGSVYGSTPERELHRKRRPAGQRRRDRQADRFFQLGPVRRARRRADPQRQALLFRERREEQALGPDQRVRRRLDDQRLQQPGERRRIQGHPDQQVRLQPRRARRLQHAHELRPPARQARLQRHERPPALVPLQLRRLPQRRQRRPQLHHLHLRDGRVHDHRQDELGRAAGQQRLRRRVVQPGPRRLPDDPGRPRGSGPVPVRVRLQHPEFGLHGQRNVFPRRRDRAVVRGELAQPGHPRGHRRLHAHQGRPHDHDRDPQRVLQVREPLHPGRLRDVFLQQPR